MKRKKKNLCDEPMLERPQEPEIGRRIQLTSIEVSELLAEGVITVLIMFMLNIAIVMILSMIMNDSNELINIVYTLKIWLSSRFNSPVFYSWQKFVLTGLLIIDLFVVAWRLVRRYRQLQMRHIISELHYISKGNYNHRIPFQLNGDLGQIITSINSLVDSTVKAIQDERKIEQSKDELISNVSHDIRTPLTSIIGYLGLIEENEHLPNDHSKNYAHIAYKKSIQMKYLVDDLFEYMNVRQPTVNIQFQQFDMIALVEQLAFDFSLEAEMNHIEISVHSELERLSMQGNPEKIVRIFNNIFSNAFKYGKGATKIELSIQVIEENQEKFAQIIVRNNGEKIPEESLSHLFERFYRADTSRNAEISGTGLGLAIAQAIVELHHGKIRATSDDTWTNFVVELPIVQKKL